MIDYNATNCLCGAHRRPQSPTQIVAEFPEVRREEHFSLYRVDAYLPHPYHLAFEADGAYWHKDHVKRDAERDAYLMREHNLPVVRLTELELLAVED